MSRSCAREPHRGIPLDMGNRGPSRISVDIMPDAGALATYRSMSRRRRAPESRRPASVLDKAAARNIAHVTASSKTSYIPRNRGTSPISGSVHSLCFVHRYLLDRLQGPLCHCFSRFRMRAMSRPDGTARSQRHDTALLCPIYVAGSMLAWPHRLPRSFPAPPGSRLVTP